MLQGVCCKCGAIRGINFLCKYVSVSACALDVCVGVCVEKKMCWALWEVAALLRDLHFNILFMSPDACIYTSLISYLKCACVFEPVCSVYGLEEAAALLRVLPLLHNLLTLQLISAKSTRCINCCLLEIDGRF